MISDYLKNTFLILIGLHFIFQAKNYYSLIIKFEVKEVMYFILYLCASQTSPLVMVIFNTVINLIFSYEY